MENKLTWVALKKAVAQQSGLTDQEVSRILGIWLDQMAEALKRGEEVHINGLGTWRMKAMKARKSVDVTTGQAIVLPATNRLTYTMAAGLEEQMKDSAPTKLAVGIDPIKKLGEQADEILDILSEMGQGSKKVEPAKPVEPEKPIEPEKLVEPKKPEKKEKKERLWLTAGITILVFIALLIGLFFFFQYKLEQWINNLRVEAEMIEQVEPIESVEPVDTIEPIDTIESIDTVELATPAVNNYREYSEFIGTEQMHQDSRLAWMAYRYYGKKQLWVFIYDANKDHLSDPEHITVGTPINIPKLSQEIIDLGTPELEALVKDMADEFLGK